MSDQVGNQNVGFLTSRLKWLMRENLPFAYVINKGTDQPRHLSHLIMLFLRKYSTLTFYARNYKPLARSCNCTSQFEFNMVGSREDWFSWDESPIKAEIHLKLFVLFMFFNCKCYSEINFRIEIICMIQLV